MPKYAMAHSPAARSRQSAKNGMKRPRRGGCGAAEAGREPRHLYADIVVAAGGQGQFKQLMGCGRHGEAGIGHDALNLLLCNESPQAVGTEQQSVSGQQRNVFEIDFNAGVVSQAARQHGGVRMVARLLRGDEVAVEQSLHGGVIAGEANKPAVARQISTAVADVADAGAEAGDILQQQRQHDRGPHTLVRRAVEAGGLNDAGIDTRGRLADGAISRVIGRQGRKVFVESLHRHPRGDCAALVTADAVGNDQKLAQRDAGVKNRVLILFTREAAVALLGKGDWRLAGGLWAIHGWTSLAAGNLCLERFHNSRTLSDAVQGGIFLRKMPHESSGFEVRQLWNRRRGRARKIVVSDEASIWTIVLPNTLRTRRMKNWHPAGSRRTERNCAMVRLHCGCHSLWVAVARAQDANHGADRGQQHQAEPSHRISKLVAVLDGGG